MLGHDHVGTEHILLGLIRDGEGAAAKVMMSLGISLEAVRGEVHDIVGRGTEPPASVIPFTPRAKRLIDLSRLEAMTLGHNCVGTEHILLGLIHEDLIHDGDGSGGGDVAARVLVNLGAELGGVRRQVIETLTASAGGGQTQSVPDATTEDIRQLRHEADRTVLHSHGIELDGGESMPGVMFERFTDESLQASTLAEEEARTLGHAEIGPEHLLLALIRQRDSTAALALSALGFSFDDIRHRVLGVAGNRRHKTANRIPVGPSMQEGSWRPGAAGGIPDRSGPHRHRIPLTWTFAPGGLAR